MDILNKLGGSATVMVLGMIVVFVGLLILIIAIKLMGLIVHGKQRDEAPAAAVNAIPAAPVLPAQQDDLHLVAVIMAAILAGESAASGKTLVVRSVRRLGGSAWAGAGRREQLGL